MERIPVFSDTIASVGFDETTEVLEVQFLNGVVYHYLGVSIELYAFLMASGNFNEIYFSEKSKENIRNIR